MICYLDSSVVLRKIFRGSNSLAQWSRIRQGISSRLLQLECLRTIDRLHLRSTLSDEETAECRVRLIRITNQTGLLPVTEAVFKRAEEPFATPLGSLDGIHLGTAILLRETRGDGFVFATHDEELALAARAHGFQVIGV